MVHGGFRMPPRAPSRPLLWSARRLSFWSLRERFLALERIEILFFMGNLRATREAGCVPTAPRRACPSLRWGGNLGAQPADLAPSLGAPRHPRDLLGSGRSVLAGPVGHKCRLAGSLLPSGVH